MTAEVVFLLEEDCRIVSLLPDFSFDAEMQAEEGSQSLPTLLTLIGATEATLEALVELRLPQDTQILGEFVQLPEGEDRSPRSRRAF